MNFLQLPLLLLSSILPRHRVITHSEPALMTAASTSVWCLLFQGHSWKGPAHSRFLYFFKGQLCSTCVLVLIRSKRKPTESSDSLKTLCVWSLDDERGWFEELKYRCDPAELQGRVTSRRPNLNKQLVRNYSHGTSTLTQLTSAHMSSHWVWCKHSQSSCCFQTSYKVLTLDD